MADSTIRVGKVSAVDYEKGTVAVVYADRDSSVTAAIPMLSSRYDLPDVGDQVLVLHLSNGAEAGVVLGRFYSDKNLPKENGKGIFRIDFDRDGTAYLRCESKAVKIKGDTVTIDGNLIVTGNINVSGSVTVGGGVTAGGDVVAGGTSLKSHTHTGVHGGTSAPN